MRTQRGKADAIDGFLCGFFEISQIVYISLIINCDFLQYIETPQEHLEAILLAPKLMVRIRLDVCTIDG